MFHSRLAILILSLCFVSCNNQSSPKNSCFRMNLYNDPATLDPRKAHDLDTVTICRMLYEGLTRVSKDGKPELALAETVEISPDGFEYVFRLRKSKWSNGEAVTSYDFAESWKQILCPDFPTNISHQLYLYSECKRS